VAAAGLVALSLWLDFSAASTYRYGLLCASVLTVALIALLRSVHGFTPERIREPRILSFSSDMSYGVYLFHWPLLIVCSNLPFVAMGAVAAAGVALVLSLALAALVAYWALPIVMRASIGIHRNTSIQPQQQSEAYMANGGSNDYGGRKRLPEKIALSLMLAVCVALGGLAVYRAPVINPIEREMYIAYIYQDSDGLYDLSRAGEALGVSTTPTVPVTTTPPIGPETPPPTTHPTAPVTPPSSASPIPPVTPPTAPVTPPTSPSPSVPPPPTNPPENAEFLWDVLVIGDSVCLGARKALLETLPNAKVDTEGSRQVWQGYNLMMREQNAGRLPEYVVISLGTNVNKNVFDYIEKIIGDIAPGHRLIFVTPYNGKVGKSTLSYKTADYIRELPDRFAFVTVADWAETIAPHPNAIGADKIHIGGNKDGIALYVECVTEALWVAAAKPAK
jgi:hypothetical protein